MLPKKICSRGILWLKLLILSYSILEGCQRRTMGSWMWRLNSGWNRSGYGLRRDLREGRQGGCLCKSTGQIEKREGGKGGKVEGEEGASWYPFKSPVPLIDDSESISYYSDSTAAATLSEQGGSVSACLFVCGWVCVCVFAWKRKALAVWRTLMDSCGMMLFHVIEMSASCRFTQCHKVFYTQEEV